MWPSRDIRMNSDGENEFVVFAIEIIEVIPPDVFHITRVDKSVAVWCLFDEHHRRQVVDVPVRWNFNKSSLWSMLQWLHPGLCLLGIVNLCPAVARAQIVCLTVLMAHAVIVLDAIIQK